MSSGKISKNDLKHDFKHNINSIVLVLALVVLIILQNTMGLSRTTLNLIPQMAISIILAVSLNLVVGFLGELSLGHAGFMCIGAYIGSYFAIFLNGIIENKIIGLIISIFVGGLVAALFGFLIGLPALRLKGDYLAIVTLAFGEIVRNIFKNLDVFGGALGLKTNKITIKNKELFIIAIIVAIITLILVQNLVRSKHGRAITAIRDNEIAAKAMGINVTFYKIFVFVIAAFFAGVAGVLYGHFVNPVTYGAFDYNYSIEILVMVVLGGMGSLNGSIIAAILITFVSTTLQNMLSGDLASLKLIIYAFILIIMVLFNNAPSWKKIRNTIGIQPLVNKIKSKSKHTSNPSKIREDEAKWDRIETKIKMDEILSVDVIPGNEFVPDKKKGDK